MEKLPQRVHRTYLIKEAEHFREHKKGIPEWIKNSDDSYTRHEEFNKADFTELPIIINFNKEEITCLDFGGANYYDMIEHIPFYGSPEAATHGKDMGKRSVSGGHGNGGKYYALSQFEKCYIMNYYGEKFTVLLLTKEGDYVEEQNNNQIGYDGVIKRMGIDQWDYFSKKGNDLFKSIYIKKLNLFCWKGIFPKDTRCLSTAREVSKLVSAIANHPQARSTLRNRVVHILFEGRLVWPSLKPEEVELDESFGIREFNLPNDLGGYKFNKHFNSVLKVILSKTHLIGDKSSMNILEIDSFGKNVAYYNMPSLLFDKGLSKNLFACVDCPELKEYNCISNDRVYLVDNELTRIFLNWCKFKIQEVLEELTNKEKKIAEKKDLEELGGFLKDIVQEVAELLNEDILTPVYEKDGLNKLKVKVKTNEPGFGGDHHIRKKGGGKRSGGTTEKEEESKDKKSKSKLKILLSNHDPDPLCDDGKTYDMIERQPVLFQRTSDVNYGIWWINSQKRYIKKIKIRDPGAIPFYFFLVKEIILSHRFRKRFREQERYDPDGLEEINFDLIDEIFNRTVEKLGIELSLDQNSAEKIREAIKSKKKFSVVGLSEELGIDSMCIHMFINNPANNVLDNFDLKKEKVEKGRPPINVYTRK